jgi:hypothetical protein
MNNSSKKLIIILLSGMMLIGAIFIYFFYTSQEAKIVEINFVSSCAVCEDGENVPTKIAMFSEVYPDDENDIQYISKLSFKRLDLDRITDTIVFSKTIDKFSKTEEMSEMFLQERNNLPASVGMYINEPKSQNKSLENEIKMVKHFFLVCQGSAKVDNRVYFDSQDMLKKHISEEIKSGKLNEEGFKPNSIVIVLDCCMNEEVIEEDPKGGGKGGQPTPPQPVDVNDPVVDQPQGGGNTIASKYSGNIKQNENTISWNPDLATADQLTITFKSEVDGKVLVSEDVSGKSSYYFSYSNSLYEGSKIKVSINGTWNNGSKISGSSSLSTTTLECH